MLSKIPLQAELDIGGHDDYDEIISHPQATHLMAGVRLIHTRRRRPAIDGKEGREDTDE